ncbi:MAG: hypothetical protein HOB69_03315 [Flavobacterium sp.]|nr:hypothetical protein [Flavobacterium sp.]
MTLDELLLEWSYRSERGYPSTDNPSDVLVLKEILTKLDLSEADVSSILDELEDDDDKTGPKTYGNKDGKKGLEGFEDSDEDEERLKKIAPKPKDEEEEEEETPKEPEPEVESGLTTYDLVIKKALESQELWEGSMPIPKGNYKWPGEFGGTFDEQVASADIKLWDVMFPLAPPKKGDPDSVSKGVGNGELALYWLYKYSGTVNVTEGREGDNPDLEFGGVGVEVKAYGSHTGKAGLGRFGQDTKQLKLLGMIFGINALVQGFKEKDPGKKWAPKDRNPLTWKGSDLIEAFEVVEQFHNVDISQLAEIYPLFEEIENNMKWMETNLGGWKNAEEGARKMAKEFVMPKLGRKPRDGGYLANCKLPKGYDIRFFNIDLEKIITREDAINHISTSQGNMKINYQEIFGNN